MFKWQPRFIRLFVVLGAVAAYAVASGAGERWF
jgi:hypothetical protein